MPDAGVGILPLHATRTVDSAAFYRTGDYPEFAPGYHVILGDGRVVTVSWDQVSSEHILAVHRYLTYQSTILPTAFENQGSVS